MRLLILTQKVDQDDDVLGFFHGWLLEFAKHFSQITVITLGEGKHSLPSNVRVLSLGKEKAFSRLHYLLRFYRFIISERNNYDTVFVHMNQEYVLLGAFLWKLFGKKILLWRNHAKGSVFTRIAVWFSDVVFCTSKESFTAQFSKTVRMPVGVDTHFFAPNPSLVRKSHSLLFLGRISPVKKVEKLLEALRELEKEQQTTRSLLQGAPWKEIRRMER